MVDTRARIKIADVEVSAYPVATFGAVSARGGVPTKTWASGTSVVGSAIPRSITDPCWQAILAATETETDARAAIEAIFDACDRGDWGGGQPELGLGIWKVGGETEDRFVLVVVEDLGVAVDPDPATLRYSERDWTGVSPITSVGPQLIALAKECSWQEVRDWATSSTS